MSLTPKTYPVLALAISAGLLIGAWIFQYGLGYPPCQMCYWQRHAHKAVILAAVVILALAFTGKSNARLSTSLLIALFLVSFGLAFWHMGVEFKWWEGPKTCAVGNVDLDFSAEDLLGSLGDKIKPPACADAPWHFLGLSMAAWNAVISFGGALAGLFSLKKKSGKTSNA